MITQLPGKLQGLSGYWPPTPSFSEASRGTQTWKRKSDKPFLPSTRECRPIAFSPSPDELAEGPRLALSPSSDELAHPGELDEPPVEPFEESEAHLLIEDYAEKETLEYVTGAILHRLGCSVCSEKLVTYYPMRSLFTEEMHLHRRVLCYNQKTLRLEPSPVAWNQL